MAAIRAGSDAVPRPPMPGFEPADRRCYHAAGSNP